MSQDAKAFKKQQWYIFIFRTLLTPFEVPCTFKLAVVIPEIALSLKSSHQIKLS